MARERHSKRADVKSRDVARLRSGRFEALLEEEMQTKGTTKKEARKVVVSFLKAVVEDVEATVAAANPHLKQRYCRVMVMYEKVKVAEATSSAIVTPGGELIKENYQYLHRIANNTMRFFLCRSIWCSEMNGGQGNFYGLNTDWIHTEVTGGGQYACPACGSQFKAGSRTTAVIPAHFAMVMTASESVML